MEASHGQIASEAVAASVVCVAAQQLSKQSVEGWKRGNQPPGGFKIMAARRQG